MGRSLKSVIAALFCLTLLASASFAATLYDACQSPEDMYTINEATGAGTLLGPVGSNISLDNPGLAYDSSTGTMYISDIYQYVGNGNSALGTVNLLTGTVTWIGPHVNSANIVGLAYDSKNDVLYGSDRDHSCLVTINRATGESSTCIGGPYSAAANLDIEGLAYDPATDILYGISLDSNLYTINRTTGVATLVGSTGQAEQMTSLDIDHDTEIMYAGGFNYDIFTVNKTTGGATLVGPSNTYDLSGLASVPKPAVTSIPTVNAAGLIGLVLLLAGMSLVALRFGRG